MVINRIDPLSIGKVAGVVYGGIGLLFGAVVSMFAMIGGVAGGLANDEPAGAIVGLVFGAGAIVILPLFYGVMAAIMAMLGAVLYNVVAGLIGGIRIDAS